VKILLIFVVCTPIHFWNRTVSQTHFDINLVDLFKHNNILLQASMRLLSTSTSTVVFSHNGVH